MPAGIDEVLVDLVGDDEEIALAGEAGDLGQFVAGQDGAGGVVRGVEEEQAGLVGDGVPQRPLSLNVLPIQNLPQFRNLAAHSQHGSGVLLARMLVNGVESNRPSDLGLRSFLPLERRQMTPKKVPLRCFPTSTGN